MHRSYEEQLVSIKRKNAKMNIMRSLVLFILSFILLVFAALAWFLQGGTSTVAGFDINIEHSEGIGVDGLGRLTLNLPCATKRADATIDAVDLSRAMNYVTYTVAANGSPFQVNVVIDSNYRELNYFVYSPATADVNDIDIATALKAANNTDINVPKRITPAGDGTPVIVVFWDEYGTDNFGDTLKHSTPNASSIYKTYSNISVTFAAVSG